MYIHPTSITELSYLDCIDNQCYIVGCRGSYSSCLGCTTHQCCYIILGAEVVTPAASTVLATSVTLLGAEAATPAALAVLATSATILGAETGTPAALAVPATNATLLGAEAAGVAALVFLVVFGHQCYIVGCSGNYSNCFGCIGHQCYIVMGCRGSYFGSISHHNDKCSTIKVHSSRMQYKFLHQDCHYQYLIPQVLKGIQLTAVISHLNISYGHILDHNTYTDDLYKERIIAIVNVSASSKLQDVDEFTVQFVILNQE